MNPRWRLPGRLSLSALAAALLVTLAGCSGGTGAEASGTAGSTSPATGTTTPAGTTPAARTPASTGAAVTIIGAGDVAGDKENAAATAALIDAAAPAAVFTTGDNAYPDGSASDYATRYEPTWGGFKDRTHPVPGNHDYDTDGAAGYVGYFGKANVTNDVDGGLYYAWDVGNGWRAYAVNTEIDTSGAQLTWLRNDVAQHPGAHLILYGHTPRYTSSSVHQPSEDICPLWNALAETGGLEIVLAGHNHQYERFAPMDCAGKKSADGARSFVVGSGGNNLYGFASPRPGSEFRNNTDFGVLSIQLQRDSYEWAFIASGKGQERAGKGHTGSAGEVLDKGGADVPG
jgi:acid phosphatase type 7